MERHSGKPLYLTQNPQPLRRLGIVLYNLFHIASQKLLRIISGIGVAYICYASVKAYLEEQEKD